jgi:hypothetical protein
VKLPAACPVSDRITWVIGGAVVMPVAAVAPVMLLEASVAVAPRPSEVPAPVPVIGGGTANVPKEIETLALVRTALFAAPARPRAAAARTAKVNDLRIVLLL